MAPPTMARSAATFVLLACLLASQAAAVAGQVNICYFTNWARYRAGLINQGKDIFEVGLPGDLCTHVMYGFATVTADFQLTSNDPNADHPSGSETQAQLCPSACNDPSFKPDWSDPAGLRCDWPCSPSRLYRGYEGLTVGMKRKNPSIKGLISVGGWNFNDCAASSTATFGQGSATCEIFSTIASTEANSRSFARNIITFCRRWGFDGFDLDWEYPVIAGHNSNQKVGGAFVNTTRDYTNYVNLLRILKKEFVAENATNPLLLTAAVGVGKDTVDNAYNVPEMNRYLDLINLMTYDLHGAWESRTGCNANLYATEEDTLLGGGVGAGVAVQGYPLSVSWAVDYWLQRGASAGKLTMGLGAYGRGWRLADPSHSGYNAAVTGASTPGSSTQEAGYLAYYEVQELLSSGKATRVYDEQRQCPYAVTAVGEWVGYDDEQSIRAKVDFARGRGLAGTMWWALDLDDFTGTYGAKVPYPLVRLARSGTPATSSTSAASSAPSTTAAAATTTIAKASTTLKLATSTTVKLATSTSLRSASTTTTSTRSTTTTTSIRSPTTSSLRLATTTSRPAASSASAVPSKGCVRNTDCAVNAWCQDTSYDSWCTSMGQAGSCPLPQCTISTKAAALATSAALPVELASAAITCARNSDCTVNAWCQDAAYDSWCASMGQAGACPSPQCTTGAASDTTAAAAVTATTTRAVVATTTAQAAATTTTARAVASATTTKAVATTRTVRSVTTTTAKAAATTTSVRVTTTTTTSTTKMASSTATSSSAFLSTSSSSSKPASTTLSPSTSTRATTASTSVPGSADSTVAAVIRALQVANAAGVFMYDSGAGLVQSDLYTWPDMIQAVQLMATKGVGSAKFWLGEAADPAVYGLVNVAAFLAQSMQETIQYNACDENNWSDQSVATAAGGAVYPAAAACGQLKQSYQHYTCSAEEDALAGGHMACEVDPNMELRASTQASWYGAPPKLFCAPRSKVPKAPRWDYTSPWCAPEGGWGYVAPFPAAADLPAYFQYVSSGGSCRDYQGIKTGGWSFSGAGCVDGTCPGSPAPLFGLAEGRTDVEGCCWWGRGVIQTTGVCNFGKLNYYLGKRAAQEGRSAAYPTVDFCKNPGAICDAGGPPELKWVAGLFYWINAVQPYSSSGWAYQAELRRWVDAGMKAGDASFIDGASGIVNRGCHNPPRCGTGELHAGPERAANFRKVLAAMGLV